MDPNPYAPQVSFANLDEPVQPMYGMSGPSQVPAPAPVSVPAPGVAGPPMPYGTPAPPSAVQPGAVGVPRPGWTVGRSGEYHKPPALEPSIKAPKFEEYVMQQVLSNDNEHNTVANLKDTDIQSFVKPYMDDIIGLAASQGVALDANKIKAMTAEAQNDVYNNMPQWRKRFEAEEARYKARNQPKEEGPGFFGSLAKGAKAGAAELAGLGADTKLLYQLYGPGKTDPEAVKEALTTRQEVNDYMGQNATPSVHDVLKGNAGWLDWAGGLIGENIMMLIPGLGAGKIAEKGAAKGVQLLGSQATKKLVADAGMKASAEIIAKGGTAAEAQLAAKTAALEVAKKTVGKTASTAAQIATFGGQGAVGSAGMTVREGEAKGELPTKANVLKSAAGGAVAGALPLGVEAKGVQRALGGGPGGYTGNVLTRLAKSGTAMAGANVAGTAAGRLGRGEELLSPEAQEQYLEAGAAGPILGIPGALRRGTVAPLREPGAVTAGAGGGEGAAGAEAGAGAARGGLGAVPSPHLSPEGQAAFSEVFNDSAIAPGTHERFTPVALKSALEDLGDALKASGESEDSIKTAKADFEKQWMARHTGATTTAAPATPEISAAPDNTALIDKLNKEREVQTRLWKSSPDFAHDAEIRIAAIDKQLADLKAETPPPETPAAPAGEITPEDAAAAVGEPTAAEKFLAAHQPDEANINTALEGLKKQREQVVQSLIANPGDRAHLQNTVDRIDSMMDDLEKKLGTIKKAPPAVAETPAVTETPVPEATNVLKKEEPAPVQRSAESVQRSIDSFKKMLTSAEASHALYSKQEGSKHHIPRVERDIADLKATIARLETELKGTVGEEPPLSAPESRAAIEKRGPLYSDHEIVTAPDMDVRYPLGVLRAALTRAREKLNREPTKKDIEDEAKFILAIHEVNIEDRARVEALGELLETDPNASPSRGEITAKAGEYFDKSKNRTHQDVFRERIAQREKHPKIRLQNVLLKEADKARQETIAEEAKRRIAAEKIREAKEEAAYKQRQADYLRQHPEIAAEEARIAAEAEAAKMQEEARKAEQKREKELQQDIETHREMLEVQKKYEKEAKEAQEELTKLKKGKNVLKNAAAIKAADTKVKQKTAKANKAKADADRAKEKVERSRQPQPKQAPPKNVLVKKTLADLKPKKGEAGAAAKTKTAGKLKASAARPKVNQSLIAEASRDAMLKQHYADQINEALKKRAQELANKAEKEGLDLKELAKTDPTYNKLQSDKRIADRNAKDAWERHLFFAQTERGSGVRRGLVSQPTENAKDVARAINATLESKGKPTGVKIEEIKRESLSPELREAIDQVTAGTGQRIIVVRNLTPELYDFAGLNYGNKFLYVNENATFPVVTVAGHEFLHQLKVDNPELYKELAAEIARQGKLKEYKDDLIRRNYEDVTQDLTVEELTADATGDALSDPEFLEALAKRNPSVFRRIADAFMRFLDTILGRENLGSNKFLTDVEAFRSKLLDVMERYQPKQDALLQKMVDTMYKPSEIKMSRGAPTTAEEAIEAAKEWEKTPPNLITTGRDMLKKGPDTLEPTRWQKFMQTMVNTIQPLQDYNEFMERRGHKVSTAENIYMAFTVLRGRQIFEQSADHSNFIHPILDALRVASERHGMKDTQFMGLFSQWIRAKDALKTNNRYELENIKLTPEAEKLRAPLKQAVRDGTFKGNYLLELKSIVDAPGAKLEQSVDPVTGLTNVEAHKLIKAVNKAGFTNEMGESFNKAFHPLRMRVTENQLRSGSFSEQDVRQQQSYANEYYMPKSDWADEDVRVPQKVFGSPLGSFDRMAYLGRETPIDDPVQAMFNKLLFSSKDIADNEATKVILKAAQDPNQKLGARVSVFDMDKLAKEALAGGKSLANMKKIAAGPSTIIHNEGSKRYVITFPETSQQLRAIKESQNPVALHGIHKAIAKPTGLYGRFHTALSPAFAMVNAVVRDGLYAPGMMAFQGKADLIPRYMANYMKSGGPMGAWRAYLKWDSVLPKAATFADMEKFAKANPNTTAGMLYRLEKAGGGFNFRDEFNNAKKLDKLRDEINRQGGGTVNALRRGFNYITELQDAVATGSMMTGRIAAFEAAMSKGMTEKEAAFYVRRLLDYQQTSEGGRILNSWFAFARVGITGVDALLSALKNEKGQIEPKKAAVGMMLMGVATASAYAAMKSVLGDDKTKQLSNDALAKNVTLPNPFDPNSPIQLPIELGMPRLAWGLAMMATRVAEGDTTAKSAGRTIKNLFLENVSPLHPIEAEEGADSGTVAADLAGALVPSIARPGYESFINQTAFGSHIHEQQAYTQGYASEAGRITTGAMYKQLATMFREKLGLDVYPETIKHLLSAYDPGAVSLLLKGMEKEDMKEAGLETDMSQATIFSALFNHDLKYAAGKEYHRTKLGLQEARKEADLLESKDKEIPSDIQEKVALDKEFIKASREHSKAVKTVTENKLLGSTVKAVRLAAIQKDWERTQRELSKQAHALEH